MEFMHQTSGAVPVSIALRVGQHGFVSVNLHLENGLVEVAVLVGERTFKKQHFVTEGQHRLFVKILHEIVVDVVFGGNIKFDVNVLAGNTLFQHRQRVSDTIGGVVVKTSHEMGRDYQLFISHLAHAFNHEDAVFGRLRAIIDTRNQVRVHVASQPKIP